MANPVFDHTIQEIIIEMRKRAHLLNAWMNPRVSREAIILNAAADALEGCCKSSENIPQS